MAKFHTLVASVNNLYLHSENTIKFHCYNEYNDILATRIGKRKRKKCVEFFYDNGCGAGVSTFGRSWRLCAATEVRVAENTRNRNGDAQSHNLFIEIPVTCYQILGVSDEAEKDEIVKSVMHLKNAEIEEGYTTDVVISRQNLLMDVRDKLLFEPEYAGNVKEKQPPKSSFRIPWAWLPAALCLLQEVGEEKLVLDIGRRALQHPDSKPFIHDLLLSMALAECTIAKVGFMKNKISQGFEALARAQCLLRSKVSLEQMTLLSQIEESLEELAPACTLELLGMPHTPENAERRLGAIAALRELLGQGLDVESSCHVQDWPCFLNQALNKLMAVEVVELISWDKLARTRKNRKSLESQNQRGIVDFNCFYTVLIAHIALGFSSKQTDQIDKAKTICECLIASEGIDLKFEEAFCLLLLRQGDEATAAERLRQLELNSSPTSRNSLQMQEVGEVSIPTKSLETWLKDAVLSSFPDTRDCSPSLANFFSTEKRGNRPNKRAPQVMSNMRHRPLAPALASDRKDEEPVSCTDSSRHLGLAVKQLSPSNLQSPLTEVKSNAGNGSTSSIQLKRSLGARQSEAWKFWLNPTEGFGKIIFATALGCILFALLKLTKMQFWKMGNGSRWGIYKPMIESSSSSLSANSSTDLSCRYSTIKGNSVSRKLRRLFAMLKVQLSDNPEATDLQTASLAGGLSSSRTSRFRRPMPMEEAETLVKRWQAIKAAVLGPDHDVDGLFDVLDGSMLSQWQALAVAAKTRSCFWKFVLLQLTVLKAEIFKDGIGNEMAEIEVLLEEAAELVDESQPKNPTYYSTYRIQYYLKRQDDGLWKFCEGNVETA